MPPGAQGPLSMSRLQRLARRLQRRWHVYLLRQRGWPDPAGTLDWLENRNTVLLDRNGHEQ